MVSYIKWEVDYYSEAVEEGILQWPAKILAKYLRIMDLVEIEGPDLGMPFTKSMGEGLFEIRSKAQEGIARASFCVIQNNRIIILHSFIKKTDKTPRKEMKIAKKRLKELRK